MKEPVNQKFKAALRQPVTGFAVFGLTVIGLVATSMALSANRPLSAEPASNTQLSSQQIEQIVHDYLMREPELIYKAIDVLEQRERDNRLKKIHLAVLEHQEELYNNPATPTGGNPDGDMTLVEFVDYR